MPNKIFNMFSNGALDQAGFFNKKLKIEESFDYSEEGNYFDTFSKEQTREKRIYEAKLKALNLFEEYNYRCRHWDDIITKEKLIPGNSDSLPIIIEIGIYDYVNRVLNFLNDECLPLNLIDGAHLKEILGVYNHLREAGAWWRLFEFSGIEFSGILSRAMAKIGH